MTSIDREHFHRLIGAMDDIIDFIRVSGLHEQLESEIVLVRLARRHWRTAFAKSKYV
jgi:hypothetical protein